MEKVSAVYLKVSILARATKLEKLWIRLTSRRKTNTEGSRVSFPGEKRPSTIRFNILFLPAEEKVRSFQPC
ncbi:Hypothetical predicted protein [Cloeon dipterum]|uniref:Uncharacterized protein n=1 Tax=Cloeon dipterum TaxID=197152 RepID=A0A8S1EDV2_9INSE|nr:Hypothetical predicted protein [Cloeon dipterum]